ncbi:MAG: hypothetical protein KDJ33_09555 [Gammaproteobacteria bacterium]|nr:hypothetical protein [Gammaproteobacteria bacterium]
MNTRAALSAALTLFAVPVLAASEAIVFPADATLPDDPRVTAFYGAQCEQWADARGLQGIERQSYVDGCRANGPAIWPVGSEESSGGGE